MHPENITSTKLYSIFDIGLVYSRQLTWQFLKIINSTLSYVIKYGNIAKQSLIFTEVYLLQQFILFYGFIAMVDFFFVAYLALNYFIVRGKF